MPAGLEDKLLASCPGKMRPYQWEWESRRPTGKRNGIERLSLRRRIRHPFRGLSVRCVVVDASSTPLPGPQRHQHSSSSHQRPTAALNPFCSPTESTTTFWSVLLAAAHPSSTPKHQQTQQRQSNSLFVRSFPIFSCFLLKRLAATGGLSCLGL